MFRLVVLISVINLCYGLGRHLYDHPSNSAQGYGDAGSPLFLTPYIRNGQISLARNLSHVGKAVSESVKSFSGFLTVNPIYDSNMFFWYFPATEANPLKAPLLLWLQGGPGGTDMFGLFVEVGPLKVTSDYKIVIKEYHWAKRYNLLFIDNPVGTGFSFTKDDRGYANNQNDVARDLYEALQQFLTVFPELRPNDFYVTGESYAGKYIPAISYKIHVENKKASKARRIKLRGLAIGDGLTDPVNQLDYSDLLYQIGLLDRNQAKTVRKYEDKARQYIKQEKFLAAFREFDVLLNGDKYPYPTLFHNYTGLKFYYNFVEAVSPAEFNYFNSLLAKDEIRKAIHVGNGTFSDGSVVESHLLADVMKSVSNWLAVLMNNYKVMLYNGQLDIIVAPILTENFLQKLKWKYSEEYKNANRTIYKVSPSDDNVAGYVRKVRDFYQVVIRNAGHILPFDQPRVGYDMITRFVDGKGFE